MEHVPVVRAEREREGGAERLEHAFGQRSVRSPELIVEHRVERSGGVGREGAHAEPAVQKGVERVAVVGPVLQPVRRGDERADRERHAEPASAALRATAPRELRRAHEQRERGPGDEHRGLVLGEQRRAEQRGEQGDRARREVGPGAHQRQQDGRGEERGDVVGRDAQVGVVEQHAGEEEERRPGAAHAGARGGPAHHRHDRREREQEEGELEVRARLDAVEQPEPRQRERPRVQHARQVRQRPLVPALDEGLDAPRGGVVLGDRQVVPARVVRGVLG